ncbi:hypothetical protein P7C73_g4585, partial [Tremellales sp. Uapishka_1]
MSFYANTTPFAFAGVQTHGSRGPRYGPAAHHPHGHPVPFYSAPPPPPSPRHFEVPEHNEFAFHPNHFAHASSPRHGPHGCHAHHDSHGHYGLGTRPGHTDIASLEAEEAAALAHLRAIQGRRQAAAAQAAFEAEAHAEAERSRQAALQRRIAIEARVRAEIEAAERQRQAAIERHAAINAQARAESQARAFEHRIEEEKRRFLQRLQGARAQMMQQKKEEWIAKQLATRCRSRYVPFSDPMPASLLTCPTSAETGTSQATAPQKANPEVVHLNNILGSLFGINLVAEQEGATKEEVQPTAPATTVDTAPAPEESAAPAEEASAPAPAEKAEVFPKEINDLMSTFLGLRVDPVSETSSSPKTESSTKAEQTVVDGVPQGLNEFLGRFGLQFFPDTGTTEDLSATPTPAPSTSQQPETPQPATPVASVETKVEDPTPTAKPAPPFTSLIDNYANLPPFLRDILSNVEAAVTEDVQCRRRGGHCRQNKGKGVAEGEKKEREVPSTSALPPAVTAQPEPFSASAANAAPLAEEASTEEATPSPSIAINSLEQISNQLSDLKSSFTFPSRLSFATTAPSADVPPLLFNRLNSPYHAQAHQLLQLLLKADGISSGGDKEVRRKRKEVVKLVEQELEFLEQKRDELWEVIRAQRESGDLDESDDEGHRSSGESSVDADEHHQTEEVQAQPPLSPTVEDVEEGYEVPAQTEHVEVEEATEVAKPAVVKSDEVKPEDVESEEAKSEEEKPEEKEKEDGYELL